MFYFFNYFFQLLNASVKELCNQQRGRAEQKRVLSECSSVSRSPSPPSQDLDGNGRYVVSSFIDFKFIYKNYLVTLIDAGCHRRQKIVGRNRKSCFLLLCSLAIEIIDHFLIFLNYTMTMIPLRNMRVEAMSPLRTKPIPLSS